MQKLYKWNLWICGIACVILMVSLLLGEYEWSKLSAVITAVALAVGIGAVQSLRGYQYTIWIVAAVVAGMIYPQAFMNWGSIDLRNKTLILIIIQLVMFGMGTQMSLNDFRGLSTTGKGLLVGLLSQFAIMPLMGLLLITVFNFEPEIAAGVILIGSCSSGLASNVMVYLAKANLTLSVILTAVATLAAPFITPLLMKILAGTLIEVKFVNMMIEIIKIVIVPIGAALLHDYLKHSGYRKRRPIYLAAIVCAIYALGILFWGYNLLNENGASVATLQSLELSGFLAGSVVAGVFYNLLQRKYPGVNQFMPYISMFGIIYFTTITTAVGRDNLLKVGFLLFVASIIHNTAGYFLGYWLSRFLGMDAGSSRTIALEVGLQNGDMASGLAGSMGKLATVGLAPAVFSPWMNISGSILANYWKRRPVKEENRENYTSKWKKLRNILYTRQKRHLINR